MRAYMDRTGWIKRWRMGFFAICLIFSVGFSNAEAGNPSVEFERAQLRLNCALASMAAYHGELNRTMEQMLTNRGWTAEQHYEESSAAQTGYTLFHAVAPKTDRSFWILAIAGTENRKDAEVDLRMHRIAFGGNSIDEFKRVAEQEERPAGTPLVHQGFHDYTMAALFGNAASEREERTFGERIVESLASHPEEKLYLTGHSLGGAVAVLATARLIDLGVRPEQLEVITFGAPAVGNEAFARTYEHAVHLERIVMKGDPVKSVLQSVSGGYVQFGAKKELRPLKGLERFAHDMVLYLDGAIRDYYDAVREEEQSGVDMSRMHRQARFSPKVYVAPLQIEIEESMQTARPYMEMLLQDELMGELQNPVFSAEQADISALCQAAQQTDCDYVLVRRLEGKRMRFSEKEFHITMEEAIFDARGNLMDACSSSTSTKHMTPLEAAAYVYEKGSEMRETVFGA